MLITVERLCCTFTTERQRPVLDKKKNRPPADSEGICARANAQYI